MRVTPFLAEIFLNGAGRAGTKHREFVHLMRAGIFAAFAGIGPVIDADRKSAAITHRLAVHSYCACTFGNVQRVPNGSLCIATASMPP
jgi:hypothetical protein